MKDDYIKKENLKDRIYYKGDCRNSEFAIWIKEIEKFIYMRTKFDDIFAETICCPEDDQRYDVFYAECEADMNEIPDFKIVPEKDINYQIEYEYKLKK